jgi:hypothetical protein
MIAHGVRAVRTPTRRRYKARWPVNVDDRTRLRSDISP